MPAEKPAPTDPPPAPASGTFISHLLELRDRLLYALIVVGLVAVGLLIYSNEVYLLVADPLIAVLPKGSSMIATDIVSPFMTPVKLAIMVAVVISIPFILYQLWAFVAPGLYRHERRLVMPLLVSSTLLFYCGMAFAYFIVFPLVFNFFIRTAPPGVLVMTDIKAYLDFVYAMFFAFGIAFEVPVAVVLLAWMGAVNPETLAKKRPYVILWIFIIAAVLTPPDVGSQIALAVPMYGLFEIGLFVARYLIRRKAHEEAGGDHRALTAQEMDAELDAYEKQNPTGGKPKE